MRDNSNCATLVKTTLLTVRRRYLSVKDRSPLATTAWPRSARSSANRCSARQTSPRATVATNWLSYFLTPTRTARSSSPGACLQQLVRWISRTVPLRSEGSLQHRFGGNGAEPERHIPRTARARGSCPLRAQAGWSQPRHNPAYVLTRLARRPITKLRASPRGAAVFTATRVQVEVERLLSYTSSGDRDKNVTTSAVICVHLRGRAGQYTLKNAYAWGYGCEYPDCNAPRCV